MSSTGQSSLVDRMIRAAKVEPVLYEEVEADESATSQAATVVIIGAVAAGIAAAIGAVLAGENPIGPLIVAIVLAIVGWVVWSYITYFIGTRMMGGTATPGELLRTIGFAQAPQVLQILSFIPFIGGLISLAIGIWVLWAGIVAVRQALDFDTGKAVVTVLIGFIVYLVIIFVLGAALIAPFAAMGA